MVQRNVRRFLLGFIDQRTPVLFVIGAVLLGLVSNAAYECLRGRLGGPIGVLAVLAGVAVLLIVASVLYTLIVKDLSPSVGVSVPGKPVGQHEGLIALVSYGRVSDIPATAAIRYHLGDTDGRGAGSLRYCWLIATEPPREDALDPTAGVGAGIAEPAQSSARNATNLRERHKDRLEKIEVITIGDADDPEDTFVAVDEAYRRARKRYGLKARQVIADFTGGTKAMTAGMVLACVGQGRRLEYMKPRKYRPDGRADPEEGSEARLVQVDFFVHAGGPGGEEKA